MKTILVLGAGAMGSGIAQVAAVAGYTVYLRDIKEEFVNKGIGGIAKGLDRQVDKGKMEKAKRDEIMGRIKGVVDIKDAKDVDIVIEAAIENMEIKKSIFKDLDEAMPEKTILATNTSSLSITEVAAATKRPDKVIGMHFMNPVPVMKLVEIIRGLATSDETYKAVRDESVHLNKVPVEVRDVPGFISNRVLQIMINEAIYCLYEGVASVEDIDTVMKLGMNHPMGPLLLADFIGLDTVLSIMETLYEGYSDSKYRPCPLLRQYVKAGWLGKKSGRGFYKYE